MKDKFHLLFLVGFGVILGLIISYILFIFGSITILEHMRINIESIIIDLNETEMVDYMICRINETYC